MGFYHGRDILSKAHPSSVSVNDRELAVLEQELKKLQASTSGFNKEQDPIRDYLTSAGEAIEKVLENEKQHPIANAETLRLLTRLVSNLNTWPASLYALGGIARIHHQIIVATGELNSPHGAPT